jgi:hypothetical protein
MVGHFARAVKIFGGHGGAKTGAKIQVNVRIVPILKNLARLKRTR